MSWLIYITEKKRQEAELETQRHALEKTTSPAEQRAAFMIVCLRACTSPLAPSPTITISFKNESMLMMFISHTGVNTAQKPRVIADQGSPRTCAAQQACLKNSEATTHTQKTHITQMSHQNPSN